MHKCIIHTFRFRFLFLHTYFHYFKSLHKMIFKATFGFTLHSDIQTGIELQNNLGVFPKISARNFLTGGK